DGMRQPMAEISAGFTRAHAQNDALLALSRNQADHLIAAAQRAADVFKEAIQYQGDSIDRVAQLVIDQVGVLERTAEAQARELAGHAERTVASLRARIAEQATTITSMFDGMIEKSERIRDMGQSQSEFLANASEQATVVAVAMRETLKEQARALNTAASEISARAAEAGEALHHHVEELTGSIRRAVEENAEGLNHATAA